ncbi:MAG TPA: fibronectin type III domain-containing protein [Dissulfurispiraceae bacterium]
MKPLFRERLLYLLLLMVVPLFFSCGKKGDPTLYTFEKPSPVKDIKALHREDKITLSWPYPADEREIIKGFYVEKAEVDERGAFKNLAFLKSDASRFVDTEFKAGRTYFYKMRVYSLRDVISDESPVLRVTPAELPPPPSGLSYKVTGNAVEISWERVPGSKVSYNIYRSYEKGVYPPSPLNGTPLQEPFFEDKVNLERVSYYTVRSLLDTPIMDEGYPSAELAVDPASFVPSSPFGLKFVPSHKKVFLMWNENPEPWVRGYRIYRKRAGETEFRIIGESLTPAFTDPEPLTSETFYYVTAVGPQKESRPSEFIKVQPIVER